MVTMRLVSLSFPLLLWLASSPSLGQEPSAAASDVERLSRELQNTRADLAKSQQQIEELRQSVEALKQQIQSLKPETDSAATSEEPTVAEADQQVGFLAAKVSELHQDKVESASKYPVKLSGLILFNSYVNGGSVLNSDVPVLAFPRTPGSASGSIGATLSQTLLGAEVKGPTVFGGHSSGNVSIDFAGGSPTTSYGATAGLIRLRTANARLDWQNTSLTIGQDAPFFSPLSPTSYASVEEPALSWAGNLWVWTPQVVGEQRIGLSSDSSFVLQGGFLDPLTEQPPPFQDRTANAAEASRVPAAAGRIALDRHAALVLPFTIGVGSYRARQRYESFSEIGSWTVNTDFNIGLSRNLFLSGEFYKGRATGGLGGGIWTSVIYPEAAGPYSGVHGLHSTGGWAQLKFKPTTQFEFNGAMGQDGNSGRDLRFFPVPYTTFGSPAFQKNRAGFVNFVYTPKTALLFAVEYRRLFTAPAFSPGASADQVNLAGGVRF